MKIGPALHGDSLGFKSAETGQLNIHASQVEAQLPALQVIAGRAGELGAIVGEQNVAELRLTSREAEVRAQETEGLSIKTHLGHQQVPAAAQVLEGSRQVQACVQGPGNRISEPRERFKVVHVGILQAKVTLDL